MSWREALCALIRKAEPNPAGWLAAVVRVAEETGRVRPERLPILGAISLDNAVGALLTEAKKHGLSEGDVVACAVTALGVSS